VHLCHSIRRPVDTNLHKCVRRDPEKIKYVYIKVVKKKKLVNKLSEKNIKITFYFLGWISEQRTTVYVYICTYHI